MLRWLPLLLLALPFVELWLLLKMAERTSGTTTFWWVIGSAFFGIWMAKWQLVRNAERMQASAERGEVSVGAIAESTLILAGGVLLVLPGPITDTLGLLLLVPPIRRFVATQLARGARFEVHSYQYRRGGAGGGFSSEGHGPGRDAGLNDWIENGPQDSDVIDSYVVKRPQGLPQDPPTDEVR